MEGISHTRTVRMERKMKRVVVTGCKKEHNLAVISHLTRKNVGPCVMPIGIVDKRER